MVKYIELAAKVAKAIAAGLLAGAGAYSTAQLAGDVTLVNWVAVLAVGLAAGLGTFKIRNAPA
jgi:hypothetical protein